MERALAVLDRAILTISVAGWFLSLGFAVYGASLFPAPMSGTPLIAGQALLFVLLPLGFFFVVRLRTLTRDLTTSEINAFRYSSCPRWMRLSAYGSMTVGALLFVIPGLLEMYDYIPPADYASGNEMSSTVIGGFGLLAYAALSAQLYSARMRANKSLERTRDR